MGDLRTFFNLTLCFGLCMFVQGSNDEHLKAFIRNNVMEGFQKLEMMDYENQAISKDCSQAMATYTIAGNAQKEWALRMSDSDGSIEGLPGVLYGNYFANGAFDQCNTIKATYDTVEDWNGTVVGVHDFDTKYCRLKFARFEADRGFIQGVCVPSKCTDNEVQLLYMQGPSPFKYAACSPPREDLGKDVGAIISIAVLSLFGLLVLVASIFDYVRTQIREREKLKMDTLPGAQAADLKLDTKRKPGKASRALLSFSLYTNMPRLFSTRSPPGAFTAMNGLRFMAMSWIVLGHAYDIIDHLTANPLSRQNIRPRFLHQIITNMSVSVEIFFVLGGCLVMISFLKIIKRVQIEMHGLSRCRRTLLALKEYGLYIFHRYWRLTPVFGFIMMYVAHIFIYTGDGPIFPPSASFYPNSVNCKQNWWVNMLYLHNFLALDNTCLGWAWYLACDFQFYLFVPLHAWLFTKSPVLGGLFAFVCWGVCLANRVSLLLIDGAIKNQFQDMYIKPATKYGPYVIGMVLGYILYRTKGKVKLHKFWVFLGWLLSLALMSLAVFGSFRRACDMAVEGCIGWGGLGNLVGVYYACQRDMFSLGLAWVIFACVSGYGGPLNRFLSWNLWTPLSRLTYSGYLIHLIVQDYALLTRRATLYTQYITIIYLYLGNLVLSLLLAVVATLVFEIPFLELEKVILPKKKKA